MRKLQKLILEFFKDNLRIRKIYLTEKENIYLAEINYKEQRNYYMAKNTLYLIKIIQV